MKISSTITALNKVTDQLAELEKTMQQKQAATDPKDITPAQLIAALDILTKCWVNMTGDDFIQSMHGGKQIKLKWIPDTVKPYWRGKFRKMQRNGWASLWSTVSGDFRETYANGLISFFNNQTTGQDGQKESK